MKQARNLTCGWTLCEQFPAVSAEVTPFCRRLSKSKVDLSSVASFAAEATQDVSGNLKDQELTDSVMLETEPRPCMTLKLTTLVSVALSEDEDAETPEAGRMLISLPLQTEMSRKPASPSRNWATSPFWKSATWLSRDLRWWQIYAVLNISATMEFNSTACKDMPQQKTC